MQRTWRAQTATDADGAKGSVQHRLSSKTNQTQSHHVSENRSKQISAAAFLERREGRRRGPRSLCHGLQAGLLAFRSPALALPQSPRGEQRRTHRF